MAVGDMWAKTWRQWGSEPWVYWGAGFLGRVGQPRSWGRRSTRGRGGWTRGVGIGGTQKWPLSLWLSNQWTASDTKADERQNIGGYLPKELAEKKESGKALPETEGTQKGSQQGPELLPLTITSEETSSSESRGGGRKACEKCGVEAWLGQNTTELGEASAPGMQ